MTCPEPAVLVWLIFDIPLVHSLVTWNSYGNELSLINWTRGNVKFNAMLALSWQDSTLNHFFSLEKTFFYKIFELIGTPVSWNTASTAYMQHLTAAVRGVLCSDVMISLQWARQPVQWPAAFKAQSVTQCWPGPGLLLVQTSGYRPLIGHHHPDLSLYKCHVMFFSEKAFLVDKTDPSDVHRNAYFMKDLPNS